MEKEKKSIQCFEKALDLDEKYPGAHLAYYNIGIYYENKFLFNKAIEYYTKAIEKDKEFYDAFWNRGLILLLLGHLKKGWEDYEYRFKKKKSSDTRNFRKPKWDGSNLDGKRILIASEQGFGDCVQFIRYLSLVKEKGGHIILETHNELKRLFEKIPFIDELYEKKKGKVPEIAFDYYIHLMSLPAIFNTTLSTIPNKVPYLKTDLISDEKFKKMIKNYNGFKIGIVWAGNPKHENDSKRSLAFENFKQIENIPGVKLFSLQKGIALEHLKNSNIIDLSPEITDFYDTACIINNLDLIVSVDTSVTHLAGALGKHVWVLLPFVPDWRYLLDRKDSPWYPTMKLLRQPSPGEWESVFREVKKSIENIAKPALLSKREFLSPKF